MVKISIIIPVHNTETYLEECLKSAVNQTLRDIEIICIDDASTDASGIILKKYKNSDKRIRIITYNTNKSASQARKDGVFVASGKYIMFMDSDDTLESTACEYLFNKIEDEKVDILQFGTYVDSLPNVKSSSIEFFNRFVKPCTWHLYGKDVFDACFSDRKYRFNLWNKIYKSELCKKAFSFIEDGSFPKAQDLYAYFIIAWFAESYYGIEDKFYHYKYGAGITGGGKKGSVQTIRRHCTQRKVAEKLKEFLFSQNAWNQYSTDWNRMCNDLLGECLGHCRKNTLEEDCPAAFDVIAEVWGLTQVHKYIQKHFSVDEINELMKLANGSSSLKADCFREMVSMSKERQLVNPIDRNVYKQYESVIPVVFATNDNYACFAGVAVESLKRKMNSHNYYKVYVLYDKLTVKHIRMLESLNANNLSVECVNVAWLLEQKHANLVTRAHFSKETYYRFLIPEIFPFYKRVVYLDSDLILNEDIAKIIPKTLDFYYIAAVRNYVGQKTKIRLMKDFNIAAEDYINAGVVVINVELWNKEKVAEKCFDFLNNVDPAQLVYLDQDVLNVVCNKKILYLDEAWNFYWNMLHGDSEYVKQCSVISNRLFCDYKILHFASDKKPWKDTALQLADEFWMVAKESIFYDEILFKSARLYSENLYVSLQKDFAKKDKEHSKEVESLKKEIKGLKKEAQKQKTIEKKIKNSISFRIGRKITFIPRKIRGGIKCYHEHGLKYTIKRSLYHLGLKY